MESKTQSPNSSSTILEEESQVSHSSLRDTAPAVARQSISPDLESKSLDSSSSSSRAAQSGVAIHSPNTQNLESSIDSKETSANAERYPLFCHEKSSDFSRNDGTAVDCHAPKNACNDSKNTLDSISIIIPCFNEKSTIADILQAVQSVPIPYHKEIIIVDDCSTDGTREILATLEQDSVLGEQCGSVADFVKGTNAKFANLPQNPQSSHSPTAIPRILEKDNQGKYDKPYREQTSLEKVDSRNFDNKAQNLTTPQAEGFCDDFVGCQAIGKGATLAVVTADDCADSRKSAQKPTPKPESSISLKIIYHDKNQGKGAALRTGITHASGDIVLIQDADLEYDPNEYPKLLAPFEKGVADVVFGSRFVSGESHRVLYFWHRMGNGLLTLLSNMMTNLNLTDMETCYKVFKREIIQRITIEENRFGFEPEITAKIAKIKGIRIYEVGISYYGRTYEEGKKIGVKDGFRALWAIVKYRFKH